MPVLTELLALSLLPALANLVGAAAAEVAPASRRTRSLIVYVATGVMLGLIALELAPRAFQNVSTARAALGFLLGGIVYLVIDGLMDMLRGGSRLERLEGRAAPELTGWAGAAMTLGAVSIDLLIEGLLIGIAATFSWALALLLTFALTIANLSEGFAVDNILRRRGLTRGSRLLLAAALTIPTLVGVGLGYILLHGRTGETQLTALAFVAGNLLAAAIEAMIRLAEEAEPDLKAASLFVIGGFVSVALVDAGLTA